MPETEYVICILRGVRYAIETRSVLEIVAMPALTSVTEAPGHVVGVLNVRGAIVPVIDLASRMGAPPRPYLATNFVILISDGGRPFGILVDDVSEVRSIDDAAIESGPLYGAGADRGPRLVASMANIEGELLGILAPEAMRGGLDVPELPEADAARAMIPLRAGPAGEMADADRALLVERAAALARPASGGGTDDLVSLALFRLGDEYFGASLDSIREFTEIIDATRVPCAPEHIVGQMNLRGNILTLVDVRPALRMPMPPRGAGCKVLVLNVPELHAGVIADEVIDIITIDPATIASPPAAIEPPVDEYITGVAYHGGRMVGILDLAEIFARGELVVEG